MKNSRINKKTIKLKDLLKYKKYKLSSWVFFTTFLFFSAVMTWSYGAAWAFEDGTLSKDSFNYFFAESFDFWLVFQPLQLRMDESGLGVLFVGPFFNLILYSLILERLTVPVRFIYRRFKKTESTEESGIRQ